MTIKFKTLVPSLLLLLLLIVNACFVEKKEIEKEQEVETIILTDEILDEDTKFKNIIDSLEIIKLETSKQSTIGKITKVIYKKNKYYIFDRANSVIFIFNSKGKFINKLDKQGKGPKEYIELRDFDITEEGNIEILSYNKILTYNSQFDLIEERKALFEDNKKLIPSVHFTSNGDYDLFFRGSFGLRNSKEKGNYGVYCVNKDLKVLGRYFPTSFKYPGSHQTFYKSSGKINLSNTLGNDTIYSVDKFKIYPNYFVDFGKKKITREDMEKNRQMIYAKVAENNLIGGIEMIFENSDYMCFLFYIGHKPKQLVYNKISKETRVIHVNKETRPVPYPMSYGTTGESFFTIIEPHAYIGTKHKKTNTELPKERNELSDVQINDNPIIFKYKFNF